MVETNGHWIVQYITREVQATNEQSKPLLFGTNYNFPFTALEREIEASVESERFDRIENWIPSTIYHRHL